MKKVTQRVKISRENLVAIAKILGVELEAGDIDLFEQFSPGIYPKDYPTKLNKAAKEVDDLPVARDRQSILTDTRLDMVQLLPDLSAEALRLTGFIRQTFPENQYKARLEQCGYTAYYSPAMRKNWDNVKNLGTNMISFVKNNEATLLAKNIMPADYLADIEGLWGTFNGLLQTYKNAKANLAPATNASIEKINKLEDMLIGLFKDAGSVFKKDKVRRSYYTMANFIKQVKPTKAGGFRGGFRDAVSKRPIKDGRISVAYFNHETQTNAKGRFKVQPLPQGTYGYMFEAKGYPPVTVIDVEVRLGVMTTLKEILVEPLPPGTKGKGARITVQAEVQVPARKKVQTAETEVPEVEAAEDGTEMP